MMDDRFSVLHKSIACHIISFLNIDNLGRLMLVSRRCKSLCISVPSLTIDNGNYTHSSLSRQRFNRFVDKFLNLRALSGTKTEHLTLVWSFRGTRCDHQKKKRKKMDTFGNLAEEDLVDERLSNLCFGVGGAESVSISMVPQEGSPVLFPYDLLHSNSVKDLVFCSNNYVLKFSPSFCFNFPPRLESLTLQSALIIDDKLFSHLILELCRLKSLNIHDCSGLNTLSITSSSLEQLKIVNDKPVDLRRLEIQAPNLERIFLVWYPSGFSQTTFEHYFQSGLQDFVWYGYPVNYYSSEGAWKDLQCAALYLTYPAGKNAPSIDTHELKWVLAELERNARVLRLHGKTIELLYEIGGLETLYAVRNLAIDYCLLTDEQVPIIASFLETIYRLKTFSLTSSSSSSSLAAIDDVKAAARNEEVAMVPVEEDCGFNVEFWEKKGLRFIDGLKKASVEVHREEGNDLELVKYLVKHARDLEHMTIVCKPSLASAISRHLKSYTKAFNKVEFVLKASN